jgi:hypothetical protein
LLLTWPHNNPALDYTVNYDIGLGAALTLSTNISGTTLTSVGSGAEAFYQTALFGGTNKVRITVVLSGTNGEYYYKPIEITKALPALAKTVISGPASFTSVTRSTTSGTSATITWGTVTGAPNPVDYKLYRIEAKDVADGAYTSGTQVEVTGDWTLVPTATASLSSGTITVIDTGLSTTKGYLYALYAEVGGAKSVPVLHGLAASSVAEPDSYEVIPSYTTAGGVRTYSVTIGWSAQPGVTYTLSRAVKTTYPAPSVGDFVVIAPSPTANAGRYTVIDAPAIRKSYVYRLAATIEGVTSYFDEDLDATDDPVFQEYVDAALSVASSAATAYATDITLDLSGYTADITADIYRAEVPENLSSSPTNGDWDDSIEKAAFAKVHSDVAVDGATITDTGLTIGKQYAYRVVYKLGAVELVNEDEDLKGNAGYVQTPSVPSVSSVSDAGYNGNIYYFEVAGSALQEAEIELQRRAAGTFGAWSRVNVDTVRVTGITPPTGSSSLTSGDLYVQFGAPNTGDQTAYEYRLVLVDGAENTASTPLTSTGVISGW